MLKHSRVYDSHAEFLLRKEKLSASKNRKHQTIQFGLTSRSDKFEYEIPNNRALKLGTHKLIIRKFTHKHKHKLYSNKYPPMDLRNYHSKSYVTPVKDQDTCGGCFAFASATVLEYWSKKNGNPKSLSAQNLIDCTSAYGQPDEGCEGGLMEYVFEYAKKHPVDLDVHYPFIGIPKRCPNRLWTHVSVSDYKVLMIDENRKAEQQIPYILHHFGPISIGIDSTTMEGYKGGIFTADMCSNDIDHAVTIIGYTNDAWIIKNSWGPEWGVNGYLYLERGKNACGVAEYMVYIDSAYPNFKQQSTHWNPN
tara:strand:+ start:2267 stop:3187 length:921 start_codon:yes stop_codon:yes gene_type:complete